jgi:hypothetical protein
VFVHGREGGGEKRRRRGGIERAYLFIRHDFPKVPSPNTITQETWASTDERGVGNTNMESMRK